MTSFQANLLGFLVLVIGAVVAAFLLGAPRVWIGVGVVILVGIALVSVKLRVGPRDPNEPTRPRY